MKKIILFLIFSTTAFFANAQIEIKNSPVSDSLPTEVISDKLYKFDLRFPAQCIDKITYQKSGKKADFELSEDGTVVYLRNLVIGSGIHVECTYKDGNHDSFNKSPCSLELIVPL